MTEQPTTLFEPPAGDRPAAQLYRSGTWLDEPPPAERREKATRHRLVFHRLLEAEERLAAHDPRMPPASSGEESSDP